MFSSEPCPLPLSLSTSCSQCVNGGPSPYFSPPWCSALSGHQTINWTFWTHEPKQKFFLKHLPTDQEKLVNPVLHAISHLCSWSHTYVGWKGKRIPTQWPQQCPLSRTVNIIYLDFAGAKMPWLLEFNLQCAFSLFGAPRNRNYCGVARVSKRGSPVNLNDLALRRGWKLKVIKGSSLLRNGWKLSYAVPCFPSVFIST